MATDPGIVGPRVFDLQIALTAFDGGATDLWTHGGRFVKSLDCACTTLSKTSLTARSVKPIATGGATGPVRGPSRFGRPMLSRCRWQPPEGQEDSRA